MFDYILYCSQPSIRPQRPEAIGGNIQLGYVTLRQAVLLNGAPLFGVRLVLWTLYCLAHSQWRFPRVFIIREDDKIIHFSYLLPPLKRIILSGSDYLEIGPCWTHPRHRQRGFMRFALDVIRHDSWHAGSKFLMLCRANNEISIAAIENCGFTEIARCRRIRHKLLPTHLYKANWSSPSGEALHINSAEDDLIEERLRFNVRAHASTVGGKFDGLRTYGPKAVPLPLRSPYEAYHRELKLLSKPGTKILDICCGDGLHSLTGALAGAEVDLLDVAEEGLKLASLRAKLAGTSVNLVHSRAESLPFPDRSLDVISCAGGLSYLDFDRLILEVKRVLKPNGTFLCVDSFNQNWIYRLNRYLHYCRGDRSYSTLGRIPDVRTIAKLQDNFADVHYEYFGLLVFCLPLLNWLFSKDIQARFIRKTDNLLIPLQRYSFKILIRASQPN